MGVAGNLCIVVKDVKPLVVYDVECKMAMESMKGWETGVQSLGWEDPLEKGKATHSSILAWRIPWTVYSTGSRRIGQD